MPTNHHNPPIDHFEELREFEVLLINCRQACLNEITRLQKMYYWQNQDARIYFFQRISEFSCNKALAIHFLRTNLADQTSNWRKENSFFPKDLTDEGYNLILEKYPRDLADDYLFNFYMTTEHSLRIIACNLFSFSNESAASVSQKLVKEIFGSDKENQERKNRLFNTLFRMRNTIHNDGLHSKSSENIEIEGRKFSFEQGKFQDIKTADLMYLLNEIMNTMTEIFEHPESIKVGYIKHPFSLHYRPDVNENR